MGGFLFYEKYSVSKVLFANKRQIRRKELDEF